MTEPVKSGRRYRSRLRADQAAATKAAIIAQARAQFVNSGWQGTTIAAVARGAGVSPETIYAVFGSKIALFTETVRAAVRRKDPETPLVEQPGPTAVATAESQSRVLALFATDITDVLANVAPLMRVARTVAQSEPEIGAVYQALHEGRRHNLQLVADALVRNGPLKSGVSRTEAVATIWRLASPELFLLMTGDEGLSPQQYARWLQTSLAALLLPGG